MTRDPFKIDGQTCISFSGGRTSAYMLWRVLRSNGGTLPTECVVCFANTGKEDGATLRFVRGCGERWGVVDTIPHHGHDAGACAQFVHLLRFVAWQDIGQHFTVLGAQAQAARHAFSCGLVVA